MAIGRQCYSRARANKGLRDSGSTLVASTTVSLPAARRLAAIKCSTANASLLAPWSFSSSETRPRQKSDESTSVGLKCLRAKVDLPEPEAPMSATRESSGMTIFIAVALRKHPFVSAYPQRDRLALWEESVQCSRSVPPPWWTTFEIRRESTRSDDPCGEFSRRARFRT